MPCKRLILAALCVLLLSGCTQSGQMQTPLCRVVLEEGEGFTCDSYTAAVVPGQDAVFDLQCADGYTVTGADYGDYTLTPGAGGGVTLTIRACGIPPPSPSAWSAAGQGFATISTMAPASRRQRFP